MFRRNKPCQEGRGSLYPESLITLFSAATISRSSFATDEDFQYYLGNLVELKKDFGVNLFRPSPSGRG